MLKKEFKDEYGVVNLLTMLSNPWKEEDIKLAESLVGIRTQRIGIKNYDKERWSLEEYQAEDEEDEKRNAEIIAEYGSLEAGLKTMWDTDYVEYINIDVDNRVMFWGCGNDERSCKLDDLVIFEKGLNGKSIGVKPNGYICINDDKVYTVYQLNEDGYYAEAKFIKPETVIESVIDIIKTAFTVTEEGTSCSGFLGVEYLSKPIMIIPQIPESNLEYFDRDEVLNNLVRIDNNIKEKTGWKVLSEDIVKVEKELYSIGIRKVTNTLGAEEITKNVDVFFVKERGNNEYYCMNIK